MKSSKKLKILLLIFFLASLNLLKANNLQITSVSLLNKNTVDDYLYVQFNISWDNSWRLNFDPDHPELLHNWDAAWVFIKFRVNGGEWQHASLSNIDNNHVVPSGVIADATSDGRGVFLYRSSAGSGSNNWPAVQFKWLYGDDGVADNATNIEIKVFGIEMVYVNEGSFYVGDGYSIGHFYDASDANMLQSAHITANPVTIKVNTSRFSGIVPDDDAIINDGIYVDGDNGIDTIGGGTQINNTGFPTGYHAFYCMKYEITQQQYVDFLNTLTRTQQDRCTSRDRALTSAVIDYDPFAMAAHLGVYYRNGIYAVNTENDEVSPVTFYCNLDTTGNNINLYNQNTDGLNVACNILGWLQGTSYADWAGLRPMTELEFEKACRGPETPVAGEYAWHTTDLFSAAPYAFVDFGMSTEYPSNASTTLGNAAYEFTTGHKEANPDRIDAPVRVGVFATSTSNRVTSGASYYGIMELSGNAIERCVTLGYGMGRKFMGTHGDGLLVSSPDDEAGNATNSDWPGIDLNEESKGANYIWNGSGYRGGDWNDGLEGLKVSWRGRASIDPFGPNIGSGFRCVRTAE